MKNAYQERDDNDDVDPEDIMKLVEEEDFWFHFKFNLNLFLFFIHIFAVISKYKCIIIYYLLIILKTC